MKHVLFFFTALVCQIQNNKIKFVFTDKLKNLIKNVSVCMCLVNIYVCVCRIYINVYVLYEMNIN